MDNKEKIRTVMVFSFCDLMICPNEAIILKKRGGVLQFSLGETETVKKRLSTTILNS